MPPQSLSKASGARQTVGCADQADRSLGKSMRDQWSEGIGRWRLVEQDDVEIERLKRS